ncbi:SUKH-4 family immunity protein [Nonomuraea candida]|uniref:SUKH-4 family immunity protein n=1 Tax=Nonomuraea candida TaxID=359159 RepID=UPI0005BBD96D|nr:SUKH-4 family immunity protein [Nonomuraea candida]
MAALYGRANIFTASAAELEKFELTPKDAEALGVVGLPVDSSPFFTTEVVGRPTFLTVFDVTTSNGVDHREVIIGGPPGDRGMRFSVSAYEGFIMLIQFDGPRPKGEIVNNNLGEFLEFLYQIKLHEVRSADDPAVRDESFRQLSSRLRALDPFSFEQPDNWWSIALELCRP